MKTAAHSYVVTTPGVCGGRPRVDGHRIRVQDVAVEYEWQGLSPEEICDEHPGLSLAQVHAALACYFDHRSEILAQIREDERYVEDVRESQASSRPERPPASGT